MEDSSKPETHPPIPLTIEPPIQGHHLTGGLIFLIGSNRAAVIMSPGKDGAVMFSVPKNVPARNLFDKQKPLRILGRNHYRVADELDLPVSPNFAIAATDKKHHCVADAQFHLWSGIGTALSRRKEDGDAMIANRVRQQIHVCLRRLEKLSTAYRISLGHLAQTKQLPEPDKLSFTSDLYAHNLGTEYRSCINELYSMRDAILVASFRLNFKSADSFTMRRIKSLVTATPRKPSSDLIGKSMFDAASDRLIYLMSLHRSIALHCIGATNPVVGDVFRLKLSTGPFGEIPYVEYPLYDDVEKMEAIEKGASKAIFGGTDRDEAIRFMSLAEHVDALEFCYDCFVRLLQISSALADEIGIEPEVTSITDDEILEMTITENGVKRHFKRNKDTGKLEEVTD